MVEYSLKLSGTVTYVLPDGIICEDSNDGLTKIRDKRAFRPNPFFKSQRLAIVIRNLLETEYVRQLYSHPTKTWNLKDGLGFVGVINSTGMTKGDGSFDLKELKEGESPFKTNFFWAERSWISNDKYLKDLPTSPGDVVYIEIKRIA